MIEKIKSFKDIMIEAIKNFMIKPVQYEEISGNKIEEERKKMFDIHKKSTRNIFIVAGELEPKFYNKELANMFREKLETNKKLKISILFSKDVSLSIEERKKQLLKKDENLELCKLLKDGAFGGRFSMYLSTKRPDFHFGIADETILIEKLHKSKKQRDVLLVHNYKSLIYRYIKHFKTWSKEQGVLRLNEELFTNVA